MKKRGQIWWANFDPSIGQEIKKQRPAVIISNNLSKKYLNGYQVVPISSQTGKLYPSETIVMINGEEGKAMADQITRVSEQRFVNKFGKVTSMELENIENVIRLQLDL